MLKPPRYIKNCVSLLGLWVVEAGDWTEDSQAWCYGPQLFGTLPNYTVLTCFHLEIYSPISINLGLKKCGQCRIQ